MLPRLRLGLARRKRLVLDVLRGVSCRARLGVLGLLTVCDAGTVKPNAVMLTHGVASSRTLALLSQLCLWLAAPRHPIRGMALYPRCRVLPTAVRRA